MAEIEEFLKSQLPNLEEAKKNLERMKSYLELGEEMGFDVTEERKRYEELRRLVERWEQVTKKYVSE